MESSYKMSMIRTFVLTFLLFILIFLLTSAQNPEQRLEFLSDKIEELEEVKRGFEAKAVYHEGQAQRLQFVEGQLLWAQRHARIAQKYTQAADKVQEEIHRLEKEKTMLLMEQKR